MKGRKKKEGREEGKKERKTDSNKEGQNTF